jgi:hypothetical protein
MIHLFYALVQKLHNIATLGFNKRVNKFKVAVKTVFSCTTQLTSHHCMTFTTRNIHCHFIQCQYTVYVLTISIILLISQFAVLIYVHVRVYSIAVCTISVAMFKKQSLNNLESTLTALWTGWLRFNSSRGSRPAMWPTQPPIHSVQGFSPEGKAVGAWS